MKTKILYIAHSAGIQGAGIALLNTIKGVLAYDITPIVLLPSKGAIYNSLKQLNVKTYVIPYDMDIYPPIKGLKNSIIFLPKFIKWLLLRIIVKFKIKSIIITEKISIIHTNTSVIHWGHEISKELSIPHIWHIRECQDLGLNYKPICGMKRMKKKMADSNNTCIAITKSVFEHHNLNDNKDVVIYDGVFPEKLTNEQIIKKKENYFLFVGTLSKMKGVFDAIDAFSHIFTKYPHMEIWLAGSDYENVREYVSKMPCNDNIKLLGFIKDVYTIMRKAKAILVPSYFEGFGFITAEAMINGCLVIGRDTAGTKEQFDIGLQQKQTEIALRFNDNDELISQMEQACNMSEKTLLQYINNAKQVASYYTIENNIQNLLKIYKSKYEN